MGKDEFLTVKEVADFLECSVQAIYNRLEKDFKPYLKNENGKKYLNKRVLQYIKPQDNSIDFNKSCKDILNLLEKNNQEKDHQIAYLQDELSIERQHNREKDKQLLDTLTKLADSQAALTAGQTADKQKQLAQTIIEGQQLVVSSDVTPTPIEEKSPTLGQRFKYLFTGKQ